MSGAREGERDKKEDREGEVVAVARRAAGRNGGKSRVGTGVKRLEAVATAVAVAAAAAAAAAAAVVAAAAAVAAMEAGGGDSARCGRRWRRRRRRWWRKRGGRGWIEHDGSI